MKQRTTYRRILRRRLNAALQLRAKPTASATQPHMNPVADNIPAEVIDLSTGAFDARFPELRSPLPGRK